MLNRWWSVSATCGGWIPHCRSASKMSNNVVPLRGTLLLEPPLRRLRPCGLASGYAWFAISDGPSLRPSGRIAIRPYKHLIISDINRASG